MGYICLNCNRSPGTYWEGLERKEETYLHFLERVKNLFGNRKLDRSKAQRPETEQETQASRRSSGNQLGKPWWLQRHTHLSMGYNQPAIPLPWNSASLFLSGPQRTSNKNILLSRQGPVGCRLQMASCSMFSGDPLQVLFQPVSLGHQDTVQDYVHRLEPVPATPSRQHPLSHVFPYSLPSLPSSSSWPFS
jgi:hypothetical protein